MGRDNRGKTLNRGGPKKEPAGMLPKRENPKTKHNIEDLVAFTRQTLMTTEQVGLSLSDERFSFEIDSIDDSDANWDVKPTLKSSAADAYSAYESITDEQWKEVANIALVAIEVTTEGIGRILKADDSLDVLQSLHNQPEFENANYIVCPSKFYRKTA